MNKPFSYSMLSCYNPVIKSLGDSELLKPIEMITKNKIINMDQPFELFRIINIDQLVSKILKCEKPDQVVIENGINHNFDSRNYTVKLYYDGSAWSFLFYAPDTNLVLGKKLDDDRCDLKGIKINTINHVLDECGNPRIEIVCDIRGLESYEVSAVKGYFKRTRINYSSYYDRVRKSQEAEMNYFGNIPTIKDVYYNAPNTTIKWSDETSTTVSCCDGEEFNKEIGLMAAISRKYFEVLGMQYPRATIKKIVKNAHDQTEKTAARKAYKLVKKQKLLPAVQKEEI